MTIEVLLAIAGGARLVYAKLFKMVEYGQVLESPPINNSGWEEIG